jgi:hypothetical protein
MTLPRRHTSNVAQIEVVLIEFWVAQGRRFGIDRVLLIADVGVP